MAIHKLKLNSIYYNDSASGIKTFEIRKNDRNYQVGDILELREWVWSKADGKGVYTGETHWKIITYILDDSDYLQDGYVCLSVAPIAEPEEIEQGKGCVWCEEDNKVFHDGQHYHMFCSYCGERLEAQNGK